MREIILDSKEKTNIIRNLLNQGKSFSELASKYSINKATSVSGGETGFVSFYQMGNLADTIKKLKPGDWIGPLKKDNVFFFLQCIEQQNRQVLPYNNVRDDVSEKYKTQHFDGALDQRLEQIRAKTKIVSYPQKLITLKYN